MFCACFFILFQNLVAMTFFPVFGYLGYFSYTLNDTLLPVKEALIEKGEESWALGNVEAASKVNDVACTHFNEATECGFPHVTDLNFLMLSGRGSRFFPIRPMFYNVLGSSDEEHSQKINSKKRRKESDHSRVRFLRERIEIHHRSDGSGKKGHGL